MNREELGGARKLFFTLLWVDIVATAIIGLNAFSSVSTLRDINAGHVTVDQSMLSSFEFWENLAKLTILTLIGVGIGLVKWLNACYTYAKNTIGVTGLKNEGYTTWGWIIPFFNLFKPYQVISEIYKVGAPSYTGPEDWKRESGSGALLAWWIFWAITHLVMWVMFRMTMPSTFGENATMRGAIMATEVQAWTCVVSLAVAGLWFWVANQLTQRLFDRAPVSATSTPSMQYAFQAQTPAPRSVPSARTAETQVSQPPVAVNEDAIYQAIANELETGAEDKGLWTRTFAECGGDEKQTKVRYIKERAQRLISAERDRLNKLEQQRIAALLAAEAAEKESIAQTLARESEAQKRMNPPETPLVRKPESFSVTAPPPKEATTLDAVLFFGAIVLVAALAALAMYFR